MLRVLLVLCVFATLAVAVPAGFRNGEARQTMLNDQQGLLWPIHSIVERDGFAYVYGFPFDNLSEQLPLLRVYPIALYYHGSNDLPVVTGQEHLVAQSFVTPGYRPNPTGKIMYRVVYGAPNAPMPIDPNFSDSPSVLPYDAAFNEVLDDEGLSEEITHVNASDEPEMGEVAQIGTSEPGTPKITFGAFEEYDDLLVGREDDSAREEDPSQSTSPSIAGGESLMQGDSASSYPYSESHDSELQAELIASTSSQDLKARIEHNQARIREAKRQRKASRNARRRKKSATVASKDGELESDMLIDEDLPLTGHLLDESPEAEQQRLRLTSWQDLRESQNHDLDERESEPSFESESIKAENRATLKEEMSEYNDEAALDEADSKGIEPPVEEPSQERFLNGDASSSSTEGTFASATPTMGNVVESISLKRSSFRGDPRFAQLKPRNELFHLVRFVEEKGKLLGSQQLLDVVLSFHVALEQYMDEVEAGLAAEVESRKTIENINNLLGDPKYVKANRREQKIAITKQTTRINKLLAKLYTLLKLGRKSFEHGPRLFGKAYQLMVRQDPTVPLPPLSELIDVFKTSMSLDRKFIQLSAIYFDIKEKVNQ